MPLVYTKDTFLRIKKNRLGVVANLQAAKKKNNKGNEECDKNVEEEDETNLEKAEKV